jgi:hypothetical protein
MKTKNKINLSKEEFQILLLIEEGCDSFDSIKSFADFKPDEKIYKKILENLEKKDLITLYRNPDENNGVTIWYGRLTDKAKKQVINNCDILRPLKVFCFAKNPRLRLGGRRPQ